MTLQVADKKLKQLNGVQPTTMTVGTKTPPDPNSDIVRGQKRPSNLPYRIPVFTSGTFFRSLEIGCAFALFVAFSFFIFRFRFAPIGQIAIPLLAVFFGFSSLLFNRARAYSKGRSRVRTLYAAERAMQATLFTLVGLLVGAAFYGLFVWYGFEPNQPVSSKTALLLVFLFPYFLIQLGAVCFMLALRIASKEYLFRLSPKDLRRRIGQGL